MSAPPKPWESPGTNARADNLPASYQTPLRSSIPASSGAGIRNSLQSSVPPYCATTGSTNTRNPPQLPARPQRSGYGSSYGYGGMSGYGGSMMGYGGYGGGMYGMSNYGYGGMGSYGGYGGYGGGYGMNRYGMGYTGGSSFTRRAEESSQAAFQSIESIVQAFGSIAMMLESTHFAVINSFRAVLGVADHFSRLRGHLMSVLGALTLFRAIRNLYYKLLVFLRLRERTVSDDVWMEAKSAVVATEAKKSPRSWPIVMFFGVVLGGPWLFWKLLQSLNSDDDSAKEWATGEGDHVLARAEFDFDADNDEELSFRAGNMLRLAPKDRQPRVKGWILASLDGSSEGLIPANYVKILGLKKGKKTPAVSDVAAAPVIPSTSQSDTPVLPTQTTETAEHSSCGAQPKQEPIDLLPAQNLEVGAGSSNGDLDEFELIGNEFDELDRLQQQS